MTIWLSAQMLTAISPDILHKYIDDVENNKIVSISETTFHSGVSKIQKYF